MDDDRFLQEFRKYFDLPSAQLDDALVQDLAFDSVMILELLMLLEDIAGSVLDEKDLIDNLVTVRDASGALES